MRPLFVVPTYCSTPASVALTRRCLRSLAATVPDASDVFVIDDGSPLEREVHDESVSLGVSYEAKGINSGFSRTVNVGLARALKYGRDAVLVNADVEVEGDWWEGFYGKGKPWSEVQGALLTYPNGLVQHAGVFFSVLRREFDHIGRFGPPDMPYLRDVRRCPVTGALMFISAGCLDVVGLFDEEFRMGWEDLDFCVRAFDAGLSCHYNPDVRAIHHESAFRGAQTERILQWQTRSYARLWQKHAGLDFGEYMPTMLGV